MTLSQESFQDNQEFRDQYMLWKGMLQAGPEVWKIWRWRKGSTEGKSDNWADNFVTEEGIDNIEEEHHAILFYTRPTGQNMEVNWENVKWHVAEKRDL